MPECCWEFDQPCPFRVRAESDAEQMRKCLSDVGIDPQRVHLEHGHAAVLLNGLTEAEERLVWKAWRLIDPVNVPDKFEDWY